MFSKFFKVVAFLFLMGLLFGQNFTSLPVVAEEANRTQSIAIIADTSGENIDLVYEIRQSFNRDSRGIFLSLPANQDGIKTDYKVLSVQKRLASEDDFRDEKYQLLKEIDQLRLRVGDPDVSFRGEYIYRLEIRANHDPNSRYDFTFLDDWQDDLGLVTLRIDGQNVCDRRPTCNSEKVSFTLNPDKNEANFWVGFLLVNASYIFGFIVVYLVIFLLWYFLARDPNDNLVFDKPEFEPPKDIYPWQAHYLVEDADMNFKNIFLAYLLYLNNQKFIKIVPKNSNAKNSLAGEMGLEILKPIPPDLLPEKFALAVQKIAEEGLKEGLLSSKLSQDLDGTTTFNFIHTSLQKFYSQKPLYQPWSIAIIFYLIIFFIGFVTSDFWQQSFLIGNSILRLIFLLSLASIPGAVFLLQKWGNLNRLGADTRSYCRRYQYYLKHVEQYKLDFSNNPQEGVQYYLKSVPFAAAFGVLPQFQKYMNKIMPEMREVEETRGFWESASMASFFVPPSSDSGSGGGGFDVGGFDGGGGSW